MRGVERLFCAFGVALVLPFVVQQSLLIGERNGTRQDALELRSVPSFDGHGSAQLQRAAPRERPIARLLIPSLGADVAVFSSGIGDWAIGRGAGMIADTADLDLARNIGVASRADGSFHHLDRLAFGDLLLLETEWSLRRYRVVDRRRVDSPEAFLGFEGQAAITLVSSPAAGNNSYLIISALEVENTSTPVLTRTSHVHF